MFIRYSKATASRNLSRWFGCSETILFNAITSVWLSDSPRGRLHACSVCRSRRRRCWRCKQLLHFARGGRDRLYTGITYRGHSGDDSLQDRWFLHDRTEYNVIIFYPLECPRDTGLQLTLASIKRKHTSLRKKVSTEAFSQSPDAIQCFTVDVSNCQWRIQGATGPCAPQLS